MSPSLIALLVFLVVGIGGSLLLRRRQAPTDDVARGLDYLAGLRWRELARLVMLAMQARGYAEARDGHGIADGLPADGADILLEREGALTLLSCKYGNAAVVGAAPILGLAKSAELRGATSVVVVTPGRFDEEARRLASGQHIDLVDGASLWREVRPFVPAGALPSAAPVAASPLQLAMPWLAGLATAAIAWMLLQGADPPAAERVESVARTASPAPAAHNAVAPAVPAPSAPLDAATLEERRKETADAISTLPGIDRAIWSTQSTLLVYLESDASDPMPALCPLLARTPELAASRLQLQPPAGSEKAVRFTQCRAY